MPKLTRAAALALAICAAGCERVDPDHALQPVNPRSDAFAEQLAPLARAIGGRRIVLLGENGHGVGEFTAAKVRLVEWLHRELNFDVVVLESGFFECGHAWTRIAELSPREALFQCLRYPFQHAEILPLFERIGARRGSDRPLVLAGMDPQAQGFDSGARPAVLHDALAPIDPALAARVAAYDSALYLVADSGGLGDDLGAWVLVHGAEARAAYDSAAALTRGWQQWAFRLAGGWVDRLAARASAEADGAGGPPAEYYEFRDEWMARAVAALADSIDGARKVVVWLHNDHARYGRFAAGPHAVRSVGGFLREWYPGQTFSIGFFMGRGTVTDNARRERTVAAPAPDGIERFLAAGGHASSYLVLRGNADAVVREWAGAPRTYLRMGIESFTLVPADEFDALFYVDSVGPPTYRIPDGQAATAGAGSSH